MREKDKTVFVLGAGASMPYGYPSGNKLVSDILRKLGDPDSREIRVLNGQLGYDNAQIKQFKEELYFSQRESIDAFLEHRKEYLDIGKAMIAFCLFPCEIPERLFGDPNGNGEGIKCNWYKYLFNKINFQLWEKNQVSFITYNYDRSLEYFLYNHLKHSYAEFKDEDALAEMISTIPIVHMHGIVAKPHWEDGGKANYDPGHDGNDIQKAIDDIMIIHEKKDDAPVFKEAFKLLDEAGTVCFLGFGYHPLNLERIMKSKWHIDRDNLRIFCSCYGMINGERGFQKSFKRSRHIKFADPHWDCLDMFRYWPILQNP